MPEKNSANDTTDEAKGGGGPSRPEDGPPSTRNSEDSPDRQVAQESQQSTGQGMGQS